MTCLGSKSGSNSNTCSISYKRLISSETTKYTVWSLNSFRVIGGSELAAKIGQAVGFISFRSSPQSPRPCRKRFWVQTKPDDFFHNLEFFQVLNSEHSKYFEYQNIFATHNTYLHIILSLKQFCDSTYESVTRSCFISKQQYYHQFANHWQAQPNHFCCHMWY